MDSWTRFRTQSVLSLSYHISSLLIACSQKMMEVWRRTEMMIFSWIKGRVGWQTGPVDQKTSPQSKWLYSRYGLRVDAFVVMNVSSVWTILLQGVPLPPPEALWICVSQHEEDGRYEEGWRVFCRVHQSLHAVVAAHSHPCPGTGVSAACQLTNQNLES